MNHCLFRLPWQLFKMLKCPKGFDGRIEATYSVLELLTPLHIMMNAKISHKSFWNCSENRFIKTNPTIPLKLWVGFRPLRPHYCIFSLNFIYHNPQRRDPDLKLTLHVSGCRLKRLDGPVFSWEGQNFSWLSFAIVLLNLIFKRARENSFILSQKVMR